MNICILRHGETDWSKIGRLQGREDIPLNEAGIAQAGRVARYLSSGRWRAIISSPLLRARQTAQVIADALGMDGVEEDLRFIERDYGRASGLTMAQRTAKYPDKRYEGMEDWEDLRGRVFDGLRAYAEQYRGENFIVVSHGGVINTVLATLSDGVIGSGKTRLKIAGVSMLTYSRGKFEIVFYNQSANALLQKAHMK